MKKSNSRILDIDMEKCVENAGGNRFNLIIMAAARSREIRRQHVSSDRFEHLHANVTALLEFQSGKLGPEYIKRIR